MFRNKLAIKCMSDTLKKRIIALLLTALLLFGMVGNAFASDTETATETEISEEQQETQPAENDDEIDNEMIEPSFPSPDQSDVGDVEEGTSSEEADPANQPTEQDGVEDVSEEVAPEETNPVETAPAEIESEETVPEETVAVDPEEEPETEELQEEVQENDDSKVVDYTISEYGAFAVDDSAYEDYIPNNRNIASGITSYTKDMFDLNNPFLAALTYLGYPTQAIYNDNKLFSATWYSSGNYGTHISQNYGAKKTFTINGTTYKSPTGISYGTAAVGYETTSAGLPDVNYFKTQGSGKSLVCAAFVSYVYFNYLPNVFGDDYLPPKNSSGALLQQLHDYSAPENAHNIAMPHFIQGSLYRLNYKYVPAWEFAVARWASNNVATYIGYRAVQVTNTNQGLTKAQLNSLPVGSIMLFSNVDKNGNVIDYASHVAIYLGHTVENGVDRYWVCHCGNGRGPEIQTMDKSGKKAAQVAYMAVPTPPYIHIRKTSTNGVVAGITFTITGPNVNWSGQTDANGNLYTPLTLLKNGVTYTVKETVPNGYVCLSQNPQTITVTYGSNDVEFVNSYGFGDLQINKTSGENAPLDGFRFNIWNSDTHALTCGVSEANGKVYLTDNSYQPILNGNNKTYVFTDVIKDNTYEIAEDIGHSTHKDVFPDYVTISAVDANNNPVNVIQNKAGTGYVSSRTWRRADGEFNEADFANNKAKIKNVKFQGIRDGYKIIMEYHNVPVKMTIHKIDNSGYNNVSGIYFDISLDGTTIGRYGPTDSSGNLVVGNDLQVGKTYTVTEVVPAGYTPVTASQTITIQPGNGNSVTFTNNRLSLTIRKYDSSHYNNVGQISFKIYNANHQYIGTYQTNNSGVIQVPSNLLVYGATYYIEEIVPDGYECDGPNPKTVVMDALSKTVSFYNNGKPYDVTIHKVNSDGTNPTATFNVYEFTGEPYTLANAESLANNSSNWTLKASNISLTNGTATYTTTYSTIIKVTENPVVGYIPQKDYEIIQVSKNSSENVVNFVNIKDGSMSLFKKDQYGNGVSGIEFSVSYQGIDTPTLVSGSFTIRSKTGGAFVILDNQGNETTMDFLDMINETVRDYMVNGYNVRFTFTELNQPTGVYISDVSAVSSSSSSTITWNSDSPGIAIVNDSTFTIDSEIISSAWTNGNLSLLIINNYPELDSLASIEREGKTFDTYFCFDAQDGIDYYLNDIVTYTGLKPNTQYRLHTVYVRPDGSSIQDMGSITVNDTMFVSSSTGSGTVNQTINLRNGNFRSSVDILVQQFVYDANNTLVVQHTNLNDEDQTVHLIIPEMDSNATNAANGSQEYSANDGNLIINDSLSIENIIPGTYIVETRAYAITSNNRNRFLNNTNGEISTLSRFTTTGTSWNGTTTFSVSTADSVDTYITKIVIYEYLYYFDESNGINDCVAWHTDNNDADQTLTRIDVNSIKILKVDQNNTEIALSDAVFVITDENGEFVARGTTGSDGTVTFNNLVVGRTYYYQEIQAPVGYYLDTNKYEFKPGTNLLTFTQTNVTTSTQFTIRKTADDDNITNIKYTISVNGSTQTGAGSVTRPKEFKTGPNGMAQLNSNELGLISGTVTGPQKECPNCHSCDWTMVSSNSLNHVFKCNKCNNTISENHQNLITTYSNITAPTCSSRGRCRKNTVCQDCGYVKTYVIETIPATGHHNYVFNSANSDGTYHMKCENCTSTIDVPYEDATNIYYLNTIKMNDLVTVTEIVPNGYTAEVNPQTLVLGLDFEANFVSFHNIPTSLHLTKVCLNDEGSGGIAGIVFSIRDTKTGITHTHMTDENGHFTCDSNCAKGIIGGHTYTVTETVPAGYIVSSQNPVTFTAVAGENNVTFENMKDSTKLRIRKVVPQITPEAQDASYSFTITTTNADNTGHVVAVKKETESGTVNLEDLTIGTPYEFSLKANETIEFDGMPLDTGFQVTEESSTEYSTRFVISYLSDDGNLVENVLAEGSTYSGVVSPYGTSFDVENRYSMVGFTIQKTSSDNMVSGINFIVEKYDENNNRWRELDESPYTTGNTGIITFDEDYMIGTRIRVTEVVPQGYYTESTNPQVITLGADSSANMFSFHNIKNPGITSTTAKSLISNQETPLLDDNRTYKLQDTIVLSDLIVGQVYVVRSVLNKRTSSTGIGESITSTTTTITAQSTTQTVTVDFDITVNPTDFNDYFDFYFDTFLYKTSYAEGNLMATHYGYTEANASEQIKINHVGPLSIEKEVKGTFGDRTREFTFTLVTSTPASDVYPKTSSVTTVSTIGNTNVTSNPTTITFGTNYTFKLKHGEKLTIEKVPDGITYYVVETPVDGCLTSWSVSGTVTANGTGRRTPASGTITFVTDVINGALTGQNVKYVNDFNDISVTGVFDDAMPYAIMLATTIGFGAAHVVSRRRKKHQFD